MDSGSLVATSPYNISFHITDLLESVKQRGPDNTKAAIEFWKRAMKSDQELKIQKEIIIKNYRLRVVDAAKDLTD